MAKVLGVPSPILAWFAYTDESEVAGNAKLGEVEDKLWDLVAEYECAIRLVAKKVPIST
jgi:hypothetical protein